MSSLYRRSRTLFSLTTLAVFLFSNPVSAAVPPASRPVKKNVTTSAAPLRTAKSPSASTLQRSESSRPLQRVATAPQLRSIPKQHGTKGAQQRPGYAKIITVAGNSSVEEELRKLYIADGRPVPDFPVYQLPPEAKNQNQGNSTALQAGARQQQVVQQPSAQPQKQSATNTAAPKRRTKYGLTKVLPQRNNQSAAQKNNLTQAGSESAPAKKPGAFKRFLGRIGIGRKQSGATTPQNSAPKKTATAQATSQKPRPQQNSRPQIQKSTQAQQQAQALAQQQKLQQQRLQQQRLQQERLKQARIQQQKQAALKQQQALAAQEMEAARQQAATQSKSSSQARQYVDVDDALDNAFDEMTEEEMFNDMNAGELEIAQQQKPVSQPQIQAAPQPQVQPVPQAIAATPAQQTKTVATPAESEPQVAASELDSMDDFELQEALNDSEEFGEEMDELGNQLVQELNSAKSTPKTQNTLEMPGLVKIAKLDEGQAAEKAENKPVEAPQVAEAEAPTPAPETTSTPAPQEDSPFLMPPVETAEKEAEAPAQPETEVVTKEPSLIPVGPSEPALLKQPEATPETVVAQQETNVPEVAINEGVTQIPSDVPVTGLGHFCPVTLRTKLKLVEGEAQFRATHDSKVYWFSSYDAKEYFLSHPEMYAPAHSGNDPVLLASFNIETEGSAVFSAWYQGKLYLFTNSKTKEAFRMNPEKFIK